MIFNQSGGTSLNFKVVKNPQPANPSENTIWVNTDQKITGWYFQPTQPEDMNEGEVWFSTGTASSVAFNVLKKNSVVVHTISAKQMVSGNLTDVAAKIWQNEEWVDLWNGELYKAGNTYDNITGGWDVKSAGINSDYPNSGALPDVTYNAESVTIKQANGTSSLWHTKKKVPMTGKTKLFASVSVDMRRSNAQVHLQVRTGVSGYINSHPEVVASTMFAFEGNINTEPMLDIGSIGLSGNTEYYVCIGVYSDVTVNVNEIRTE